MKKMMKLATKTHKIIETLKAKVEATNEELQKTNENLSQLWVAANEALNKANVNKETIKDIKKLKWKTTKRTDKLAQK